MEAPTARGGQDGKVFLTAGANARTSLSGDDLKVEQAHPASHTVSQRAATQAKRDTPSSMAVRLENRAASLTMARPLIPMNMLSSKPCRLAPASRHAMGPSGPHGFQKYVSSGPCWCVYDMGGACDKRLPSRGVVKLAHARCTPCGMHRRIPRLQNLGTLSYTLLLLTALGPRSG